MFDLFKDIDKYRGKSPYASELYGVYQPLLGWQSRLTKDWIRRDGVAAGGLLRSGSIINPDVKRILDGRITPAPTHIAIRSEYDDGPRVRIADPRETGSPRSPFRVELTQDLGGELPKLVLARVQEFVEAHGGKLPRGSEWLQIVNADVIRDDLQKVNAIYRERFSPIGPIKVPLPFVGEMELPGKTEEQANNDLLEAMRYESQLAALLLFHAEGRPGNSPDLLNRFFAVKTAPAFADLLISPDPLASIDPRESGGGLSPVGLMHMFRQYFFDLGTFLGEPVEHVWLAPGTTIELIETSTRRELVEQQIETLMEITNRTERNESLKDELSDAVKEENQNSAKLGVTQSNTVNLYVYEGTVSTNFGLESTRKHSRETAHKQTREQSEKLSSEIKRSVKTIFRTVTETTDTRSRRHVLQNTKDRLINYELRRKMRRVGVQVQDIGMRLCWQVFIDNPGAELGVARLVHVAEPADLSQIKAPETIPDPPRIPQAFRLLLPMQRGPSGENETGTTYVEDSPFSTTGHVHLGDDNDKILMNYPKQIVPTPAGYRLASVQLKKVDGDHYLDPLFINLTDNSFDVHLKQVFFPVEGRLSAEVELEFLPLKSEIDRIRADNATRERKASVEEHRKIKEGYINAIRERIKLASRIAKRPSWDLREEERVVVYRQLLSQLMLDRGSEDARRRNHERSPRINHVRSEIIRSIFDVDSMLYFVVPEWWVPRPHKSRQMFTPSMTLDSMGKPVPVTTADPVGWGGIREVGRDNYDITEGSEPARLGSSLGWLLQLDGDNLRNAFLNAPWVKAVIPIRPGRERAALNWLRALETHASDGWNTPYLGVEQEFQGKTIGQVLEDVAAQLEKDNGDIQQALETDKVFETGFDMLEKAFDAGLDANNVFSQYISVLPTDQIVAEEYEPTDLFVPDP